MHNYKIWLVKEGEPLPIDGNQRLVRTGSLAAYLAARGYRVTWWASSFIHSKKEYLINRHSVVQVNANEDIVLLHSPVSYKENMSPTRIYYSDRLSREFRRHASDFDCPDLIICSWPTPQFAKEAIRYGGEHGVPVVIDVRDLWPDIYYRAVPESVRPIARRAVEFMRHEASETMRSATAIVGMSEATVKWGCELAGRERTELDETIYIGAARPRYEESIMQETLRCWDDLGVSKETWNMCFFSTLGVHLDLETVICATQKLICKYPFIRLVIGGRGVDEDRLRNIAKDTKQIIFAGWLDELKMNSLMSISKVGLYCIQNTIDFFDTFSNKAIQYLSAGLPIVNSLTGTAARLLEKYGCGVTYREGDIDDCAAILESLINDGDKLCVMGASSLELYEAQFELEKVNRQWEDFILRVIE